MISVPGLGPALPLTLRYFTRGAISAVKPEKYRLLSIVSVWKLLRLTYMY